MFPGKRTKSKSQSVMLEKDAVVGFRTDPCQWGGSAVSTGLRYRSWSLCGVGENFNT